MKRHTISSVVVLKALSCHQVERLLRLHSGMPKYSGTQTQNLKLRVTCNDSLCTENKVDYSRLRDPSITIMAIIMIAIIMTIVLMHIMFCNCHNSQ
jgi:hypothetical protein